MKQGIRKLIDDCNQHYQEHEHEDNPIYGEVPLVINDRLEDNPHRVSDRFHSAAEDIAEVENQLVHVVASLDGWIVEDQRESGMGGGEEWKVHNSHVIAFEEIRDRLEKSLKLICGERREGGGDRRRM